VERCRSELRSGLANIEAHYGPLATVLELCNETWMHTMLSEHPNGFDILFADALI